jgi:hypothetical protein
MINHRKIKFCKQGFHSALTAYGGQYRTEVQLRKSIFNFALKFIQSRLRIVHQQQPSYTQLQSLETGVLRHRHHLVDRQLSAVHHQWTGEQDRTEESGPPGTSSTCRVWDSGSLPAPVMARIVATGVSPGIHPRASLRLRGRRASRRCSTRHPGPR